MHARVFRHITKRFSTISKTVLLALFLFVATLGIATPLLAQSTADFQLKYANYLNLTTFTGSELTPAGLTQDTTTQGIVGLKFNVKFSLNTTSGKTLESAWSYIASGGSSMNTSEVFLIRLCSDENPSQCWVNTIPHRGNNEASGGGVETMPVITRIVNGNYSAGPDITNFSAFNKNDQNNNTPGGNGQRFKYDRDISNGKNEGKISAGTIDFRPGDDVTATLWYCAANTGGDTGVNAYKDMGGKGLDDTVATFDTLCDGGTYFRIGDPVSISIPTVSADINAMVNNSAATSKTVSNEDTNLPVCDISFVGNSKIVGCLARLVYYGLYWPSAWVAGLFGSLFDFFIGYSVSDESYRYEFAVNGWKLVRDIANVFFIIIMVYVGFAAVFSFGGSGGSSWKKVVPILIFNALIINFSLFATRTVIDVSNITARVFYSRMVVCDGKCVDEDNNGTPENIKRSLGGHWPLSEKIVGAFDPQRMFGASILNPKETPTGGGDIKDPLINSSAAGKKAEQGKGFAQDSNEYAGYYALVSLIAAGIMLGIAAMFFKVMFMFLGRVIGLYMAMIFSPFAFLTHGGMPLLNIDRFTWKNWASDLFKYAALAPVFIFFLYIVYSFLNTDIVKQIGVEDKTGGFFGTVLSIVIPMFFIYQIISKGVSIAERYSGEFGKIVQGWGNTVSGAALGVATGGAALAGRNIVGRVGNSIANSEWLRNRAANGNAITRRLADTGLRTGTALSTATFDLRNTRAGREIEQRTGMRLNNSITALTGTGTASTTGGFRGAITRNERVLNDRANRLQTTGAAAVAMDRANEAWESQYQARRRTAEQAALASGTVFNEAQFRFSDMRAQAAAGNARVRSAAEVNRRRERSYQAALARGSFLSRFTSLDTNRSNAATIAGAGALAGVAGAATGVGYAALSGQGAIQGEARQNVLRSRRSQARPQVSGTQRTRTLAKLARLQQDQLRVHQTLSPVAATTPGTSVGDLSVIDVQNYQASHPNHGMASPGAVIAERNRIATEIGATRTQLGI